MDLQQENEQLKQEIRQLREALKTAEAKVGIFEQKIQELTALLNQDSHNSHWPPSRDKSRKKRRTKSLRRKSDKKPGGQKGHQGHTLKMSETPDVVEIHRPTVCHHCQYPFGETERAVAIDKRQVHDLPPTQLMVTEHQAESLCCPMCGQLSQGDFPENVTSPVQYGPRVWQLGVYLKTEQFIPYERSRRFFADLFGVSLSPGTLQNAVRRAAKQLMPVVESIKAALQSDDILHCDESGFYIKGKRHWLHSASTSELTYYFAHERRGQIATEAMGILPQFKGTAIHDFWSTYQLYKSCEHALCNVHHLRDLQAVFDKTKQGWATRFQWFLLCAKKLVAQARLANLTALPQPQIDQIERIYAYLVEAALSANPPPVGGWPKGKKGKPKKTKARNLAERFEKHQGQVLAFVYDFKVPFDNNLAERDLRMLKVQQKISGCFRSQAGALDFCTIRSYLSTMRKQGISAWPALEAVFSDTISLPDFTPV